MKYVFTALVAVTALVLLAAPATADWDPNDFSKYVQHPDPTGWDVMFTEDPSGFRTVRLADDFPCYETGRITDVHLWFSVLGDYIDPREVVDKIHLSIHENIPADTAADFPWSHPGALRWEWDFPYDDEKVKIRPYDEGLQGFMYPDPECPEYIRDDHSQIWQANILIDPEDAFLQEGTAANQRIYWLDASISLKPGTYAELGWKTSQGFWEPRELDDDAVFWYEGDPAVGPPTGWYPLVDPTGKSLNLAFVITPEPGTVVMLLGAGLIGLLAYARRRRKS